MRKLTIFLFCVFLISHLSAQDQRAIRITNTTTQKEFFIKEYKRILVETTDQTKFSGRFSISDTLILIDGKKLELADVFYLKRDMVFTSALTTGLLVYGGATMAGIGTLIGVFGNPAGFIMLIPAGGLIYAGIKSPNFHKKFKTENAWTFDIVTLPE